MGKILSKKPKSELVSKYQLEALQRRLDESENHKRQIARERDDALAQVKLLKEMLLSRLRPF